MVVWSSYALTDFIPFSQATYTGLLPHYNARFAVMVVLGGLIGIGLLLLLWQPRPWRLRVALAAWGAGWLWIAWAYQLQTLSPLLWAAEPFALAFALQSGLLLGAAGAPMSAERSVCSKRMQRIGWWLLAVTVLGTPMVQLTLGYEWRSLALIGSAPSPTALATLWLALLLPARQALLMAPVPLLWCAFALLLQLGLRAAH